MYAPGTPVAVAPAPPTYELIPHRVFVGGFPATTTEVELRQHFEQFFHIREAKVIRSTEGASKGYGFITFDTEEEAESVRNMSVEKLEFKGRRLNIGPALRRMSGHRFTEYAIATPTGVVPSPALGYSYSFSQQTPYVMVGAPQPTAFVYNTPTQTQGFVYPSPTPSTPLSQHGQENHNQSPAQPAGENGTSSTPSTPSKHISGSNPSSQQIPITPVPQPMYATAPQAYYVPVPGTPVTPSLVNGVRVGSPSAVYSPSPYYVHPTSQEQVHYAQVQSGYYYPQHSQVGHQGMVYANGEPETDAHHQQSYWTSSSHVNGSPAHNPQEF